jgi:hypothetical protein
MAAAAVLGGARSMTAIAEWAADAPQPVRAALGARRDSPARCSVPARPPFAARSCSSCGSTAGPFSRVEGLFTVHLVLDNGSSPIARDTRWWFVDHPRFHPHDPPSHASWLNQVELFFSILARRLLKRGEFASVQDLVARVMAFIDDDNRTAKPFRWTYDGRPLKAS